MSAAARPSIPTWQITSNQVTREWQAYWRTPWMLFSCRNLSRNSEFVVLKHTGALPIPLDDFFSLDNAMVHPDCQKGAEPSLQPTVWPHALTTVTFPPQCTRTWDHEPKEILPSSVALPGHLITATGKGSDVGYWLPLQALEQTNSPEHTMTN